MFARSYDCLIVGAGPAGCRLALGLVGQGLEVLLLDHLRPAHSGPFESVIGWSSAGWSGAGRRAIEAALPQWEVLRRGAIWGDAQVHWQHELLLGGLIRRGSFDRQLRDACAAAGVAVAAPASLLGERSPGRWRLRVAQREVEVGARSVVFATGRSRLAGPLPPPDPIGAPLLAVAVTGTPAPEDRGSAVVEAVPDGWTWFTAVSDGPASVVLMIEPSLLQGVPSRTRLAAVLASCRGPAGRVGDWRVVAANDATPRCRPAHPRFLAVGDAAASVDPMASQGVEKALHMADSVAGLIAPAIAHPDWLEQICQGHAEREQQLAHACQQRALEFYRAEKRWPERPFWRARHALPEAPRLPPLPLAAVAVSPSIEPATVVTVAHGSCRAQAGLVERRTGRRLAQLDGLPVASLLALFAVPRPVGVAVAAAAEVPELFVASPARVTAALRELCAIGWLIPASAAGHR